MRTYTVLVSRNTPQFICIYDCNDRTNLRAGQTQCSWLNETCDSSDEDIFQNSNCCSRVPYSHCRNITFHAYCWCTPSPRIQLHRIVDQQASIHLIVKQFISMSWVVHNDHQTEPCEDCSKTRRREWHVTGFSWKLKKNNWSPHLLLHWAWEWQEFGNSQAYSPEYLCCWSKESCEGVIFFISPDILHRWVPNFFKVGPIDG